MNNKRNDSKNEGRDKAFMDVDRMINEGMCGGYVYSREGKTNLEEYVDLIEETPSNEID
ncbi:hypothetical protein [Bacillus sp. 03113]|uniref:hypothetical protein n=1 Tax=Bacillus sp. 03113 TaxID=2578211 RepID=UPI0015E8E7C2|nr:hypothetical protein [Bacillus sp. 03113]